MLWLDPHRLGPLGRKKKVTVKQLLERKFSSGADPKHADPIASASFGHGGRDFGNMVLLRLVLVRMNEQSRQAIISKRRTFFRFFFPVPSPFE